MKYSEMRQRTGVTVPDVAELLKRNRRTVYSWEDGDGVPKPTEGEELEANFGEQRKALTSEAKFHFRVFEQNHS